MKRRRAAGDASDFGSDLPTEKTLIKLNRQVIKALQTHLRTESQWSDWMDYAFELEDTNKNMVIKNMTTFFIFIGHALTYFQDFVDKTLII